MGRMGAEVRWVHYLQTQLFLPMTPKQSPLRHKGPSLLPTGSPRFGLSECSERSAVASRGMASTKQGSNWIHMYTQANKL